MSSVIEFSRDVINSINIGMALNGINKDEWNSEAGQQHYKLLGFLATQFSGKTIIDIGTHKGSSALALSACRKNKIITFDIINQLSTEVKNELVNRGVDIIIDNLWDPISRNKWEHELLKSAIIFLDVDPHNGEMEYELYCYLVGKKYTGLLVCDDIWYFKPMRDNFWYNISSDKKYDLTWYGHWSGTGLIKCTEINTEFKGHMLQVGENVGSKWKFVTAYFDLTKREDASNEIKQRDSTHYLNNANSTMAIPFQLVVYCEEKNIEQLKKIRPIHLQDKTEYRIIDFDNIPLVKKYYQIIKENRIKNQYQFDARNTASYYLLCMVRYWIMLQEIDHNDGTTHYSWINICIERMGFQNLMHINDIVSTNRDKFSTCYIDYQPKQLVNNYKEYYRYGRCSMCSGFFTGNRYYMTQFCNKILNIFDEVTNAGYGHADEQLYSIVYFRNPEIFEFYLGDYSEMIANYSHVYACTNKPLYLVISRSFEYRDWNVCMKTCKILMDSVDKNYAHLSSDEFNRLAKYVLVSAINLKDEENLLIVMNFINKWIPTFIM